LIAAPVSSGYGQSGRSHAHPQKKPALFTLAVSHLHGAHTPRHRLPVCATALVTLSAPANRTQCRMGQSNLGCSVFDILSILAADVPVAIILLGAWRTLTAADLGAQKAFGVGQISLPTHVLYPRLHILRC
jgi:hypothetical protein